MIEIVRAEQVEKSWDRFVELHPHGTLGHLRAWGPMIHAAYGHESIALAAVEAGEIAGILPLVLVKSRLFGTRLVSMPFLDYGGLLIDADAGPDVSPALFEAAIEAGRARGARTVGLRQFHEIGLADPVSDDRVTMLLPLSTADTVWKALPSERRNRVRKGEKNGLSALWGGAELLDGFLRGPRGEHARSRLAVHSRGFFASDAGAPRRTARVLQVRDRTGRPVGPPCACSCRDMIAVPWVSSRRDAFRRSAELRPLLESSASGARRAIARSTSDAHSRTPGRSSSTPSGAPRPIPCPGSSATSSLVGRRPSTRTAAASIGWSISGSACRCPAQPRGSLWPPSGPELDPCPDGLDSILNYQRPRRAPRAHRSRPLSATR